MRSATFRYILYIAAGVLLLGIIGPAVWRSCLTGGGGQLATRVKLENLRGFMAIVSMLTLDGNVEFPKSIDELLDLWEEESGSPVVRDWDDPKHPLVDGWGMMMRFEGDVRGYEIRSAGQDHEFRTEDDMYLHGDADGEFIITGTARQRVSRDDFTGRITEPPYQEPNGYYQVSFPGDYNVIPTYDGDRSEITFSYAKDMKVTISAQPQSRTWDPERELQRRLEVLRRGGDEMFREFKVVAYAQTRVAEAPGYMIDLAKGTISAREFAFMSGNRLRFSLVIITSGSDRAFIMEALTRAVHETLVIQF